jgi:hypothetical protein
MQKGAQSVLIPVYAVNNASAQRFGGEPLSIWLDNLLSKLFHICNLGPANHLYVRRQRTNLVKQMPTQKRPTISYLFTTFCRSRGGVKSKSFAAVSIFAAVSTESLQ